MNSHPLGWPKLLLFDGRLFAADADRRADGSVESTCGPTGAAGDIDDGHHRWACGSHRSRLAVAFMAHADLQVNCSPLCGHSHFSGPQ